MVTFETTIAAPSFPFFMRFFPSLCQHTVVAARSIAFPLLSSPHLSGKGNSWTDVPGGTLCPDSWNGNEFVAGRIRRGRQVGRVCTLGNVRGKWKRRRHQVSKVPGLRNLVNVHGKRERWRWLVEGGKAVAIANVRSLVSGI